MSEYIDYTTVGFPRASADPRSILEANRRHLEVFLTRYLVDEGIGLNLVEALAKAIYGQTTTTSGDAAQLPQAIIKEAINNVVDIRGGGFFDEPTITFSLDRIIKGSASLHLLVRYARLLDPAVMPRDVIPSDEVVQAALDLFHEAIGRGTIIDGESTIVE